MAPNRNREPDSDPELVMTESESDDRVKVASIAIRLKDMRTSMETMHGKLRVLESDAHAIRVSQSSTTNRIESLEGSRKVLMGVIAAVATAALGAIWTAYTATRDSGEKTGRNAQRLEQVERDVDKVERELEKINDQLQRLWTFRGRQGDPQP